MHLCLFCFRTDERYGAAALMFSLAQQTTNTVLAQVHFLWNEEVIDAINEGVRNSLIGVRAPIRRIQRGVYRCPYISVCVSFQANDSRSFLTQTILDPSQSNSKLLTKQKTRSPATSEVVCLCLDTFVLALMNTIVLRCYIRASKGESRKQLLSLLFVVAKDFHLIAHTCD